MKFLRHWRFKCNTLDGRVGFGRAAVAAAEMRTVLQMRITVRFNTMGLWRLTKGMVIHIRGLLLEYVKHRWVTKNHYRYRIERLHLFSRGL